MSAEPLTPDRRRELTRRHLLDAAASEFARNGFNGASLDDVAAAAGFTKGAVYSNFASKADLFLAVMDDRMERQAATLSEEIQVDDTPTANLAHIQEAIEETSWGTEWIALWLEFLLYAVRNPEAQEKLASMRARQRATVEAMIAGEYERRGATPKRSVPLLALISLALFDGIDVERLVDPDSITEEVETGVLEFLFDTIGVPDTPRDPSEG
jgi:AcrR family transcriptional regulator